ncbi:PEP/pyruvate-binding domain-containing protein [Lewinella sp. 4G2]|uniref:PEP/pyruvate-binding domain-containing protein n=1 Tax=Lewinella sp. 4G2 TaxID=1803372 RepID=UPI0007B4758E|nr:PEP/pyruvate-binding domain-containing protein [Lewinella sp. 4G2]OAV45709.1 phosphoenolpyruvate synthase [Lewinella sp. 4G2]
MPTRALLTFFALSLSLAAFGQTDVAALIKEYQERDRGPYQDIRWFCADGSNRHPREGCATPSKNNFQHARYLPEIVELGENEHLYLAQILTNTDKDDFWDADRNHSRMIQYQLGNYLAAIDDGWINRKGQYYRGAFQVEDEMAWGRDYLNWMMGKEEALRENFYLVRQSLKDIPHRKDDDLTQKVRNDSKAIADKYGKFMELRIKIHGQPEGKDADAVEKFLAENKEELERRDLANKMRGLIRDIRTAYVDRDIVADIDAINRTIPASAKSKLQDDIAAFVQYHRMSKDDPAEGAEDRITAAADLMLKIRQELIGESKYWRLEPMDISVALENLIFSTAHHWEPKNTREQMEKICYLGKAAAGAGFVEEWEWNEAATQLGDPNDQYVYPRAANDYLDAARRYVEWGVSTNRATFGDDVERYLEFEPKAVGFLDNRIRGSVLLPLGNTVGELGDWVARVSNLKNAVLDLPNQGSMRGLNPGYARGKLHVIEGNPEEVEVNPNDIFIFATPPADLKPVGGIATVNEGNMVSHVQLLARNLGIPNAVLTDEQFAALKKYDGQDMFYAVSNRGTVNMRPASEMTDEETELFATRERSNERITVPTDALRLDVNRLLNMREIRSKDSGKLAGPKAANLGQLKALFPNEVVEGLVIPFGIFRDHMNQRMPGQGGVSYWEFLNAKFKEAKGMEDNGIDAATVESFSLRNLATLRDAIMQIQIQPELVRALRDSFRTVLGDDLGRVPVFLRSDTNMEDLADFTGAGLNLTVFNAVEEEKIMNGIRKVWASPYTERSFKWRQRLLLNPENVFPSILIIPSVDVDYSGVMITKGVNSGLDGDVTVAFSRGAGGAVDGQAAEAYRLPYAGGNTLLTPARERLHRRLPATGGSIMVPAPFNERVLSEQNLRDLRNLSVKVEEIMPEATGETGAIPWDVELGFQNDKIYLFQIRPFVENQRAQSSDYLEKISPQPETDINLDLEAAI